MDREKYCSSPLIIVNLHQVAISDGGGECSNRLIVLLLIIPSLFGFVLTQKHSKSIILKDSGRNRGFLVCRGATQACRSASLQGCFSLSVCMGVCVYHRGPCQTVGQRKVGVPWYSLVYVCC